jgi:hypothetical protein
MIPARSWREILADARATLEPVAEAHPDLAPDALLALLLATVAGLVELEQMAGHIVDGLDRRSFCTAARCLARDRRVAQGLLEIPAGALLLALAVCSSAAVSGRERR